MVLFSDCELQLRINRRHKYKSFTPCSFVILWAQVQRHPGNSIKSAVFTVFQQIWQTYLNFSTRRSDQIRSKTLPRMWLCVLCVITLSVSLSLPLPLSIRPVRAPWAVRSREVALREEVVRQRGVWHTIPATFCCSCWVCFRGGLQKRPKRHFTVYYCGKTTRFVFGDITTGYWGPYWVSVEEPGASCSGRGELYHRVSNLDQSEWGILITRESHVRFVTLYP